MLKVQALLFKKVGAYSPSKNPIKRLIQRFLPIPVFVLDAIIVRILKIKKFNNSYYVGNLLGNWGLKEVYKKSVFDETIKLKFETCEVNAPIGYDELLRCVYGNYMELPPPEKRCSHHLVSHFDLNSSYLCEHN
jgi:lipopolysaccharide cholinephosphotransferase